MLFGQFPNITFTLPWLASNTEENSPNLGIGAIKWSVKNDTFSGFMKKDMSAGRLYDPNFDASLSNPLFGSSNNLQVDAVFSMMLIRGF